MISQFEITKAVRDLRHHFGDTQQQFAQRMGTAVITIARWETKRPPSGESLQKLLLFSDAMGLSCYSDIFRRAIDGPIQQTTERIARLNWLSRQPDTPASIRVTIRSLEKLLAKMEGKGF
jgi:transcriptional regulator with XRE-family HTH domain